MPRRSPALAGCGPVRTGPHWRQLPVGIGKVMPSVASCWRTHSTKYGANLSPEARPRGSMDSACPAATSFSSATRLACRAPRRGRCGRWTGATGDVDSGVTDSAGRVTLESNKIRTAVSGVTTFTFTVNGVTLSGWVYDPSANVETYDSVTYFK